MMRDDTGVGITLCSARRLARRYRPRSDSRDLDDFRLPRSIGSGAPSIRECASTRSSRSAAILSCQAPAGHLRKAGLPPRRRQKHHLRRRKANKGCRYQTKLSRFEQNKSCPKRFLSARNWTSEHDKQVRTRRAGQFTFSAQLRLQDGTSFAKSIRKPLRRLPDLMEATMAIDVEVLNSAGQLKSFAELRGAAGRGRGE